MNAVEIEEATSALAEQAFDAAEFPFAFLQAFGNKDTTIKRLRKGESNKSDLGGILQTNNIHIAVAHLRAPALTKVGTASGIGSCHAGAGNGSPQFQRWFFLDDWR